MKPLNSIKILLAEDEPFMRAMLEKTLVREGAWVAPCFDGADALATARSALVVDVVLLDVMMPLLHGLALLKKIRTGKAGLRYDIPVGLLTGLQDHRIVSASMLLDCDAFLIKPLNRAQLVDRVEQLKNRVGRKLGPSEAYEKVDVGDPDSIDTLPDFSALPLDELPLDEAPPDDKPPKNGAKQGAAGAALLASLAPGGNAAAAPVKIQASDRLIVMPTDRDPPKVRPAVAGD